MAQTATAGGSAALVGEAGPRERLHVIAAPGASFLSQLLAAHHHLPPQRARRRAPMGEALRAYDDGARMADRRLPPGYRKTLVI